MRCPCVKRLNREHSWRNGAGKSMSKRLNDAGSGETRLPRAISEARVPLVVGEEHAPQATSVTPMPEGRSLPWARKLADLLTLSRLLGGVAIALMPWQQTVSSLGRLVRCSVLLWSTDAVDGRIARHSHTPASWIGERDLLVDSALALGTGIALARAGYVPGKLLIAWLGAMLILYAIRPVATTVLAFMCPLQFGLPILAFVHRCPEVRLYLVWVVVVAVLSRKRLKWVIEVFISGLPNRQREWVWSWLPGWLRLTPEERATFQMPSSSGAALPHAEDSGLTF